MSNPDPCPGSGAVVPIEGDPLHSALGAIRCPDCGATEDGWDLVYESEKLPRHAPGSLDEIEEGPTPAERGERMVATFAIGWLLVCVSLEVLARIL